MHAGQISAVLKQQKGPSKVEVISTNTHQICAYKFAHMQVCAHSTLANLCIGNACVYSCHPAGTDKPDRWQENTYMKTTMRNFLKICMHLGVLIERI